MLCRCCTPRDETGQVKCASAGTRLIDKQLGSRSCTPSCTSQCTAGRLSGARAHLPDGHGLPGAAALVQRGRSCPEHAVGVLQELPAVPGQEEVPVLRAPAAAVAHEEARLPGRRVVVPAVVRPIVPPAGRAPVRRRTARLCLADSCNRDSDVASNMLQSSL